MTTTTTNNNNNQPPPRTTPIHHRRCQSETSFIFSSSSSMEEEEEEEFLFDMDSFNLSSLDLLSPSPPPPIPTPEERRVHRRTNSMDGGSCSSSMDAGDGFVMIDGVKKAMPPEQLAQLALLDPKRAKRIIANRQSAARSKERKVRYTSELERKVQTLQTEATTLSAQATLLQRDTSVINAENKELLLRLQALEQQAQLRDALNEAFTHEVNRLRIEMGEPTCNNSSSGRGHFSQLQNLAQFGGHQNQQHQFPMSNQNQPTPSHRELKPNFMDFNRRM